MDRMSITFNELNAIAGYVQNGTSSSVKYCQDDATMGWTVTVGDSSWTRDTLSEAFAAAHKELNQFN